MWRILIEAQKITLTRKNCNWGGLINISSIVSFLPPRRFFLHFFVSFLNVNLVADKEIQYSETCIKRTPLGNALVSAQYRVSA